MAESKDIEINQFPIVSSLSNKDYVVVSLDDGSQGRIKTSDLASVVAGVADNINNFFYVFKLRGTALENNPVLTAKEVVSSLVSPFCIFIGIHDYSGYKLVYGYIYNNKTMGVVYISFHNGSSYRVDIVNGEYILR